MGNRPAPRDPNGMTATRQTPTLPATLTLGAVHLTVSDLDRSVAWYQRALGLRVHAHDGDHAPRSAMAATVTLELYEDPAARPAGRHAGLYHYALLYPTREELARAAVRLSVTETPIEGASDHRTHEAIYLPDPDGNGIELAADRAKTAWPADLGYSGGPARAGLPRAAGHDRGRGRRRRRSVTGLRMGHLHLHVGDIDQGLAFYRDVLGFEVQANLGTAAFVSAGGYHHHLGFNVWRGPGVGPGAGAHRRPAPLDGRAADRRGRRGRARAGRRRRGHRRRVPHPRPVGHRRGVRDGLLERAGRERVAAPGITGAVARVEPLLARRRRSRGSSSPGPRGPMERCWMRSSPTAAAASSPSAMSCVGQVLDEAGLDGVARPTRRRSSRPAAPAAPSRRSRPRGRCPPSVGAEQVLDVVPVLVGDHVRLGERAAARAEARAQVVVEARSM